jgi:two-component system, cell cycle response regulator
MAARILIIEDNQANMDLLLYLLSAFGHVPLAAYDGERGVAMARAERPDLILCDLHLPRLDGHGVLAALRADPVTRDIPILAASAMPVTDGCAALRRAGFSGCLPKSLEPEVLIPSLEAWLPPALRSTVDAATPPAEAPAEPPASARNGVHAQANILLLDAAPENAGLAASILAHCGYGVTVASTPGQVQAAVQQPIDLVLCDLGLYEDGRTAFLADALHQLPAKPVVVIRPDDDDDVSTLSNGRTNAPVLLSHPLDPQQLVAAIESSLVR